MNNIKKPSWAQKAYQSTSVNWAKTQSAIYKMLGELGIYDIRFTNGKEKFMLEFLISIGEVYKPRAVRIITPLKYQGDDDKKRNQELNIVHRILFNRLKSKFVSVISGIVEFETEFMAELIITDKQGNSTTMGERLLPEYRKNIDEGKNGDFKLLGEGN